MLAPETNDTLLSIEKNMENSQGVISCRSQTKIDSFAAKFQLPFDMMKKKSLKDQKEHLNLNSQLTEPWLHV